MPLPGQRGSLHMHVTQDEKERSQWISAFCKEQSFKKVMSLSKNLVSFPLTASWTSILHPSHQPGRDLIYSAVPADSECICHLGGPWRCHTKHRSTCNQISINPNQGWVSNTAEQLHPLFTLLKVTVQHGDSREWMLRPTDEVFLQFPLSLCLPGRKKRPADAHLWRLSAQKEICWRGTSCTDKSPECRWVYLSLLIVNFQQTKFKLNYFFSFFCFLGISYET